MWILLSPEGWPQAAGSRDPGEGCCPARDLGPGPVRRAQSGWGSTAVPRPLRRAGPRPVGSSPDRAPGEALTSSVPWGGSWQHPAPGCRRQSALSAQCCVWELRGRTGALWDSSFRVQAPSGRAAASGWQGRSRNDSHTSPAQALPLSGALLSHWRGLAVPCARWFCKICSQRTLELIFN